MEVTTRMLLPPKMVFEDMEEYRFRDSKNAVVERFSRKNCSHLEDLEDWQLGSLAENSIIKDIDSAGQVRHLVKQLIKRYLYNYVNVQLLLDY